MKMPLNHLILEFSTDLSYMPLLSYRIISRKNQAITTSFCFISLSFHYHSSSYHSLPFYVIWLGNVWEKVLVNLFNFYRHFKSTPFHTVIRLLLILYFSFFISLFLWSINMFLLASYSDYFTSCPTALFQSSQFLTELKFNFLKLLFQFIHLMPPD